jgi:hypothetical protein
MRKQKQTDAPVVQIQPDVLYGLGDLMRITRLGNTAFRELRRKGLPIHYISNSAFVLGRSFIDCVIANSKPVKYGGTGRRKNQTAGEVPAAT